MAGWPNWGWLNHLRENLALAYYLIWAFGALGGGALLSLLVSSLRGVSSPLLLLWAALSVLGVGGAILSVRAHRADLRRGRLNPGLKILSFEGVYEVFDKRSILNIRAIVEATRDDVLYFTQKFHWSGDGSLLGSCKGNPDDRLDGPERDPSSPWMRFRYHFARPLGKGQTHDARFAVTGEDPGRQVMPFLTKNTDDDYRDVTQRVIFHGVQKPPTVWTEVIPALRTDTSVPREPLPVDEFTHEAKWAIGRPKPNWRYKIGWPPEAGPGGGVSGPGR